MATPSERKAIGEIDVRSADRSSGDPGYFTVQLPRAVTGATSIQLNEVQMIQSWYNITATNNVLYYNAATATVPPGNYSIATLLTELNALGTGITFTYYAPAATFTLALAGLALPFGTHTLNSIANTLGFPNVDLGAAASHTAPNSAYLTNLSEVYINVSACAAGNNTSTAKIFNYSFRVGVMGVQPGGLVLWRAYNAYDTRILTSDITISKIVVGVFDSQGNQIDFNGVDWTMNLSLRYD